MLLIFSHATDLILELLSPARIKLRVTKLLKCSGSVFRQKVWPRWERP